MLASTSPYATYLLDAALLRVRRNRVLFVSLYESSARCALRVLSVFGYLTLVVVC